MRWTVLLLALAGCTQVGATNTGSAGGGAGVCDNKQDCDTCIACAQQNPCAAEVTACQQDSDCLYIDSCVTQCGTDLACKSGCTSPNAAAVARYNAVRQCLYCDECPTDCAGFETCN